LTARPQRAAGASLDTDRRELKAGSTLIATQPQFFDLLADLIANRDRVISKGIRFVETVRSSLRSGLLSTRWRRALVHHIDDNRCPRTQGRALYVKIAGRRRKDGILSQVWPAAGVPVDEIAGGKIDEVGVRLLTVIGRCAAGSRRGDDDTESGVADVDLLQDGLSLLSVCRAGTDDGRDG
jgi:hypothetical protein